MYCINTSSLVFQAMLVSRVEPRRRRLFMKPTDRYMQHILVSNFSRLQILNLFPRLHWPKTRCSPARPKSQVRLHQRFHLIPLLSILFMRHIELDWFHIFQQIECSILYSRSSLLFPSQSVCQCCAHALVVWQFPKSNFENFGNNI